MLKDEERIAEVKRRIAKKEQQQRLRRRRIVSAVCIAACFAVIVGRFLCHARYCRSGSNPVLLQALKLRQQFWAAAPHWDIS